MKSLKNLLSLFVLLLVSISFYSCGLFQSRSFETIDGTWRIQSTTINAYSDDPATKMVVESVLKQQIMNSDLTVEYEANGSYFLSAFYEQQRYGTQGKFTFESGKLVMAGRERPCEFSKNSLSLVFDETKESFEKIMEDLKIPPTSDFDIDKIGVTRIIFNLKFTRIE